MRILVTSIVDLNNSLHNRPHEFVQYLRQRHEVTVLSINDWWKASQTGDRVYIQEMSSILDGVHIKHFTQRKISPIYQELFSIITLGKILKEIGHAQFDVHLNYNSLISGYFVARKMAAVGIKTVYDIADNLAAMVRSSPQIPAPLRPIGGFVGKIALRKNAAIADKITISTGVLNNLLGDYSFKAEVIPNGVDAELFKNRSSSYLRDKLALGRAFVLGYAGVLREWVDLEPAFMAIRDLKHEKQNVKLLVVGEEGGLNKHKTLAQKYGISDKVIFTGTVPYAQVPEYVSCMDVCLIPHKEHSPISQDALPLKLFEYMACEKPVISTRVKGVEEAVGERVFYASNVEELKAKIKELHENSELRRKLGVEGRRFVKENYSWAHSCSKLEDLLIELAALKRRQ